MKMYSLNKPKTVVVSLRGGSDPFSVWVAAVSPAASHGLPKRLSDPLIPALAEVLYINYLIYLELVVEVVLVLVVTAHAAVGVHLAHDGVDDLLHFLLLLLELFRVRLRVLLEPV